MTKITLTDYARTMQEDYENWNEYAEAHWICRDCDLDLDDDGRCRSCHYQIESFRNGT